MNDSEAKKIRYALDGINASLKLLTKAAVRGSSKEERAQGNIPYIYINIH